jgi:hypothetical protein
MQVSASRSLIAAVVLALSLVQCSAPCVAPSGAISLVIGTGGSDDPSTFVVVRDGVSVALTNGFQGGQHVWIQVRGVNVCERAPMINVTFRRPDRSVIAFAVGNGFTWNVVDAQTRASEWLAVQVQPNDVCRYFSGGRITAEVHVVEASGRRADVEYNVTVMGWVSTTPPAFRQSFEACCADFQNLRCYPNGPPPPEDVRVSDASTDT